MRSKWGKGGYVAILGGLDLLILGWNRWKLIGNAWPETDSSEGPTVYIRPPWDN